MNRCLALFIALVLSVSAGAQPTAADRAATSLLQQAVAVQPEGQHNSLLRALRHLKDPDLKPLFEQLADRHHPTLQIHGILGLAELNDPPRLDLARVALLDDLAAQSELVSAALDADLLTDDQCLQLLDWSGLDVGARMLIASKLIAQNKLANTDLLVESLQSSRLGRRGMAALLLHHLGDPRGYAELEALNQSDDPSRDPVRAMLLGTAMKYNLPGSANWAYAVATEPDVNAGLGLLALRTAMRYGDPRAAAHWRSTFVATAEPATRVRLALTALQLSPFLPADTFDILIQQQDPLLRQMGKTGQAIAREDPALADATVALIALQHPIANRWALSYARKEASDENALLILLGLIDAYERGGDPRSQGQRLDNAVNASQILFERSPDMAANLLRPILANPKTDALLRQGIFLGLIRSQTSGADAMAQGLPAFDHPDTQSLRLLLMLRGNPTLTDSQQRDLELIVRGGGSIEDSLRAQAAWAYLKNTGHHDEVIRAIFRP